MLSFDVNWLGIILAVVASMALGMIWYMGLAKYWISATGKTEDQLMGKGSNATPFIYAAACQLVIAFFIANLTPALMDGVLNAYNGALVGAQMWLGFILTAMIINHRYQNMSWRLTIIDGGYLLGVVLVQGMVIGLLG
ncbi:hypothetical protein MNBD_ALPHA11-315 [hydrothermal vent metagenome]|uniref:DUF1761 domain-containing protein n=1 Tax=hydrothermal vent metagenome TaxID=652676 RepID=A0A3B0U467_9ZZZZ